MAATTISDVNAALGYLILTRLLISGSVSL